MELTALEKRVLMKALEAEAPEYLPHVPHVLVARREFTGAGFYSHLSYDGEHGSGADQKRTIGQSLFGRFRGFDPSEAGFLVYIDNGMLTLIEAYSHGLSDWPRRIDAYDLIELSLLQKE